MSNPSKAYCCLNESGGGSGDQGVSTYGQITNAQILAIASPSAGESADSTDDFIRYIYFGTDMTWRSTGGGILV